MAKTCGDCEKSIESGLVEKNRDTVKRWCRCSVTGKDHLDSYQCDVPEKPRLCEVLGVEVGQRFKVHDDVHEKILGPFFVRGDGCLVVPSAVHAIDACYALTEAINHPEKIERVPRLTERERAICRMLGAKWVSRDGNCQMVILWSDRPEHNEDGWREGGEIIAWCDVKRFPTVKPGQALPVEDEP